MAHLCRRSWSRSSETSARVAGYGAPPGEAPVVASESAEGKAEPILLSAGLR